MHKKNQSLLGNSWRFSWCNTTERRKESKDAGVLEAQDERQLDKITSGKEPNAQNGTECQFPAEHKFSAVGKDFRVFVIFSPL